MIKSYSRGSSYFHRQLLQVLRSFHEQLSGAAPGSSRSSSENASWMPKMGGLLDAFETGLTKFMGVTESVPVPPTGATPKPNVVNEPVYATVPKASTAYNASVTNAYGSPEYYGGNNNQYNASGTQQYQETQPQSQYYGYAEQPTTDAQYQTSMSQDYGYNSYKEPVQTTETTQQSYEPYPNETNTSATYQPETQQYPYESSQDATATNNYTSPYSAQSPYTSKATDNQPQSTYGAPQNTYGASSYGKESSTYANVQKSPVATSDSLDSMGFGNPTPKQEKDTSHPAKVDGDDRPQMSRSNYFGITKYFTLPSMFSRTGSTASNDSSAVPKPKEVNLGETSTFVFDPVTKKWVNGAQPASSEPETLAAPPMSSFGRAPPPTPTAVSTNTSRAPSPAPPLQHNGPVAGASDLLKRGSLRRGRSRYVDTLNPNDGTESVQRTVSASFLPPTATFDAVPPKIMSFNSESMNK